MTIITKTNDGNDDHTWVVAGRPIENGGWSELSFERARNRGDGCVFCYEIGFIKYEAVQKIVEGLLLDVSVDIESDGGKFTISPWNAGETRVGWDNHRAIIVNTEELIDAILNSAVEWRELSKAGE